MHKLAIALTIFLFALASSGVEAQGDKVNLTPVIGILAKPSEYDQYPMNDWNYMAASYVKYIESAGARVVPIQWDLPFDNITRIMRSLNGFLLTGGSGAIIGESNGTLSRFGKAVEHIINNVIQFNNEGIHYPLWGTCMGYQLISCIIAGQSSGDFNCLYSQKGFVHVPANMSFFAEGEKHPIFSKMTEDVHQAFLTQGITYFNFGSTVQRDLWERNPGLKSNFTRLSYVQDEVGTNITVLIAGTKYPIYGSQFHPEKIQFEWKSPTTPHSLQAIEGAQMYVNFFVDEARKNFNTFEGSGIDLDSIIIYNYNPIQMADASFDQVYFFKRINPGPPYHSAEVEENENFLGLNDLDSKIILNH